MIETTSFEEVTQIRVKALEKKGLGISEIVRELFGGEHAFAEISNGQYTTENLVRSVLKMEV